MNAQERGQLISLREYVDFRFNELNKFLTEHWRSKDAEWAVFKSYAEKRWEDLNGEAGRLKTITENSVTSEKFNDYVSSERDKADATDKAQRSHFEAYAKNQQEVFQAYASAQAVKQEEYQRTQALAFKTYADDMGKWRASIDVRLAKWVGGGIVIIAAIQLFLKYI